MMTNALTSTLTGGITKGQLNVIAGVSNTGKSVFNFDGVDSGDLVIRFLDDRDGCPPSIGFAQFTYKNPKYRYVMDKNKDFPNSCPVSNSMWTAFRLDTWDKKELDILEKYGTEYTARKIMMNFLPDRWYVDIAAKRYRLGIRYKRTNLWTDNEESLLTAYADAPLLMLSAAILPNRTRNAIKNKKKRMGLT